MNPWDPRYGGLGQIGAISPWTAWLWKTTLLLAMAWLLHLLLTRANPRWRALLWRGVVLGLVVLALGAFGLPTWEIRLPARESTNSALPSLSLPVDEPASPVSGTVAMPTGGLRALAPEAAPALQNRQDDPSGATRRIPLEESSAPWPWQAMAMGIWGFGVTLLMFRLTVGYLRLSHPLRDLQVVPEAVSVEARRLAVELRCPRNVQIRSSRRFVVPFLYGLRPPLVVLPERMCRPDYCSRLSGILAHELAHVRSHDFAWNAAIQIVSTLLWFHPLVWRIALAHGTACDAVCDAVSAAHLGSVRAYCRTLAQVAVESARALRTPGLAMARSCDVRCRIAALDRKVFSASLERRAVVSVTAVGLLACLSLATLRLALSETAEDRAITGGPVIGEPPVDGFPWPFALQLDREKPLTVEGRVVDVAGKPLDDTHVAVTADVPTNGYFPLSPLALGQTITDAHGGFRLTTPNIPPWQCGKLAAIARRDGYGVSVQELEPGQLRHQVAFTLDEERPVRCRVVDEKGQPAAGVELRMCEFRGTGVSNWVSRCYYPFVKPVAAWSPPATSNAEGRMVIHGIPRSLTPPIRFQENVNDPRFASRTYTIDVPSDDSEVTLTLAPTTVLEGRVVCADTKAPLAGAWLKVASLDSPIRGDQQIRGVEARTDQQGRFRVRCPKGESLTVYVFPPPDVPYPMWVPEPQPWPDDARQLSLTIEVPRGVLLRGRVVEAGSGVPVADASVEYHPTRFLELDSVAQGAFWAAEGRLILTAKDGTFSFGVMPWRGNLLVKAPTPDFVGRVTSMERLQYGETAPHDGLWYSIEGLGQIDPKPGAKEIQLDIPLRRGVTIRGRIVDPHGQGVKQAVLYTELNTRLYSQFHWADWPRLVRDGRFELRGCDPAEPRQVFLLDKEHQLGAAVVLDPGKMQQDPPTICLQPCGSMTVRLLDAKGRPRVNRPVGDTDAQIDVLLMAIEERQKDMHYVPHLGWSARIVLDCPRTFRLRTDGEGRLTFPTLIPRARYMLNLEYSPNSDAAPKKQHRYFTVEPGQNLDLGEIRMN